MPEIKWVKDSLEITAEQSAKFKITVLPSEDDNWKIIKANGPCPMCEHNTKEEYPRKVYPGEIEIHKGADAYSAALTVPVTMICECGVSHPECPDDESGCGRAWILTVRFKPTLPVENPHG